MWRRVFVIGTAAVVANAAFAADEIAVIYIGGLDCPPCMSWKRAHRPEWLKSREYARITYVEVEPPSLRDAYEPRYWKENWRWVLDGLPLKRGTPRFVIVQGRSVVGNFFEGDAWKIAYWTIRHIVAGGNPFSF